VYLGDVTDVSGNEVTVRVAGASRPWTGALAEGDRAAGPQGSVSAPLPAFGGRTDAASGAAAGRLVVRPGMGIGFDAGDPEDTHEAGGPVFRVTTRGGDLVLGFGRPGPDLRRVAVGQRVWVTSDPAAVSDTQRLLRSEPPSPNAPSISRSAEALASPCASRRVLDTERFMSRHVRCGPST
jgi:putative protease